MRRVLPALALLALCAPALAAKPDEAPYDYGPTPDWSTYRALGEKGIIARLIDPDSAKISWISGPAKTLYKPLLERRVHGYVACGTVNARNRMGGYAGPKVFVVVIDYDQLLYADIDTRAGGMIAENCDAGLRSGLLPPVPEEAGTTASSATGTAPRVLASGLTLQPMPDGAYVSLVTPGSPADLAGIKPGMVIASVNAIPLKGMGDAMLKVFEAVGPNATLLIVGGRAIKLGQP